MTFHILVNRFGIHVTNNHDYVPLVVITIAPFPHLFPVTELLTSVTGWMPQMEQERLVLPVHLMSPRILSEVCVHYYLVSCVVFCRPFFVLFDPFWPCLTLFDPVWPFSVDNYIICPSSNYGFWLSYRYIFHYVMPPHCHYISVTTFWRQFKTLSQQCYSRRITVLWQA